MSLILKNVSFGYKKDKQVLHDISLNLEGDMYPLAIVGPNGSGKTTLLKTIVGIYRPHTGKVLIDGKNIHRLSAKERASLVGVLFPDRAYAASVPVIDVIMAGMYRYMKPIGGYPRNIIRQAYDVMNTLGITHLKDRLFSTLSSGERQLVLTAMVMLQSPKVILLDEPTSFLDPYHRYMLVDIIRLLSEKHQVIFTSHDIEFVKAVSHFAVGIKDGKIIYTGKTDMFLQSAFEKVFGIPFTEYIGVFGL
ncbi:MAG: ABC transporter ATP-binding protein [Dictyoglomi bacterium]|nr:ABC transporter ATP-binding protein [Dictyoglomota bacterium]